MKSYGGFLAQPGQARVGTRPGHPSSTTISHDGGRSTSFSDKAPSAETLAEQVGPHRGGMGPWRLFTTKANPSDSVKSLDITYIYIYMDNFI